MTNLNRDIMVLLKQEFISEHALQQEVDLLNKLFVQTESPESFYKAHEMVDRNRITSNKRKILKESNLYRLRPFRFLINKN